MVASRGATRIDHARFNPDLVACFEECHERIQVHAHCRACVEGHGITETLGNDLSQFSKTNAVWVGGDKINDFVPMDCDDFWHGYFGVGVLRIPWRGLWDMASRSFRMPTDGKTV